MNRYLIAAVSILEKAWVPTFLIFIVCFLLSNRVLRNSYAAFFLGTIKSVFFFGFLCYLFDGAYTPIYDDAYYLSKGMLLVEKIREEALSSIRLIDLAEQYHYAYIIASALAQFWFGEGYTSLVAINVLLTLPCGYFAYAAISAHYRNVRLARIFYVSVLLYPDLVLWSSVFPGKDTLVLLGHLLFIYSFALLVNNRQKKGFSVFFCAWLLSNNLRFYVGIVFAATIFFSLTKRWATCFLVGGILLFALRMGFLDNQGMLVSNALSALQNDFLHLPIHVLHFWLSPRPFFEEPFWSFLLPANIFNWICFPLIMLGYGMCFRSKDPVARFVFLYFSVFSILSAMAEALNGSRHRLQLIFALVFFLWKALSGLKVAGCRLLAGGSSADPLRMEDCEERGAVE